MIKIQIPIQINGSDKDSDTSRLIYTTKKSRRVQALRDFEKLFLFENFPRVRADRGQWAHGKLL